MVKKIKSKAAKTDSLPLEIKLGPIHTEHLLLQTPCVGCGNLFLPGEFFSTVPVGPGDDPQQRALAKEGLPYMAAVVPVHWSCATGYE